MRFAFLKWCPFERHIVCPSLPADLRHDMHLDILVAVPSLAVHNSKMLCGMPNSCLSVCARCVCLLCSHLCSHTRVSHINSSTSSGVLLFSCCCCLCTPGSNSALSNLQHPELLQVSRNLAFCPPEPSTYTLKSRGHASDEDPRQVALAHPRL